MVFFASNSAPIRPLQPYLELIDRDRKVCLETPSREHIEAFFNSLSTAIFRIKPELSKANLVSLCDRFDPILPLLSQLEAPLLELLQARVVFCAGELCQLLKQFHHDFDFIQKRITYLEAAAQIETVRTGHPLEIVTLYSQLLFLQKGKLSSQSRLTFLQFIEKILQNHTHSIDVRLSLDLSLEHPKQRFRASLATIDQLTALGIRNSALTNVYRQMQSSLRRQTPTDQLPQKILNQFLDDTTIRLTQLISPEPQPDPLTTPLEALWQAMTSYRNDFIEHVRLLKNETMMTQTASSSTSSSLSPILDSYSSIFQLVRNFQKNQFIRFQAFFQDHLMKNVFFFLLLPKESVRERNYDIRAVGSIGREEPTLYSDLECFILTRSTNSSYWSEFRKLLDLTCRVFGEGAQTPSALIESNDYPYKGFFFDDFSQNALGVNEPEALTDLLKGLIRSKNRKEYLFEAGALFKSTSLEVTDHQLIVDFKNSLSPKLLRKHARKLLALRLKAFRKRKKPFPLINLKNDYLEHLNHTLHDMALFHNIQTPNLLDAIEEMSEQSILTQETATLLKEIVARLYLMRLRIQIFSFNQQKAMTYYPENKNSDDILLRPPVHPSEGGKCLATPDERRLLKQADELILNPFYAKINEAFSQNKDISFPNLVLEGVRNAIKHFEQDDKEELSAYLHLWTYLPPSLQLSFYQTLSDFGVDESLRETYLTQIEKILPKEQLEIFLQVPHPMTGYRQKERIARRDLQQAILTITTTSEETPYLVVTPFIHEPRYLKQTVVEQVIDGGDLKAEPKYAAVSGNRVCSLSYEGINLHLKQAPATDKGSPFFPGKEQGVNRLTMRLFGRDCSFSELAYLINTSTQKGYFVLISQTVFGVNLNDIVENPLALAQVDLKQLTELFLSIPLILPGDHRPVNFIVESTTNLTGQTNSQLVCIDNDVAWIKPIQAKKNFLWQIKYTINIYAPLFFLFPNFNLEEEAMKEFLLLRPTSFLKAWFEEMIALNASYQQTFGRYLPSVIFPYFALEKGMGGQLFVQFCHLQSYLQKHFNRPIQAEELFNTFISYGAGHTVDVGKMLFDKYTAEKNTAGSVSEKVKRITGRDSTKSLSLSQSTKAMFSDLTLDADILRPEQSIKELNFLSLHVDKIRIVQQENGLYKVEKGFSEVIRPDGSPDLATQAALIDTIAAITCDKLDLSHCAALTDMALIRILETSGHHLTYLNLTKCLSITDQSISLLAEYCPRIEEIYLSGCTNLTMFGSKNLFGLTTWPELLFLKILHIAHCPELTTLYLRSYALMTVKADNNPNLTDVDLDALETPDTYFTHCPRLKQEWSSRLADRIALYHQQYDTKVCHALAQFYRNDSSLTELHLRSSNISAADAISLALGLQYNSSLTTLVLVDNNISTTGVASLAKALQHNDSLTTLVLISNDISTDGTTSLAETLDHNSSLTTLNLAANKIDNTGITSLTKALKHNSSLRTLNLASNNIGNKGAISLAKALKHNSFLTTLNLTNNKINILGIASLDLALEHNNSLTTLNLECNNFDSTDSSIFKENINVALERNKRLKAKETLKANSLSNAILEVNTSNIGIEVEKKKLPSSSNDHSPLILTQEKKPLSNLSPSLSDSSSHKVGTGLENSLNNCFFNTMMQLIMNSSLKDFFLNKSHLITPSKTTTQDQIDRVFAFFSNIGETYAKASQTVGNIVRYDSSEMREILGLSSDGQEDAFQAFNALCHFYNLTTLSIPLSFTTKVDLTTKIRLEAIPDDPIEIGDDGLSSSPRVEQFLTHPLTLEKIPTKMQKLVEKTFSREEICDQLIRFIHRGIPYSVNQFTRKLHFDPQNLKDELLFHVLRFNKQFEKIMTLLPEDLFEVRFGSGVNTVTYSLIGFIVHTGTTLESGHYVAYIKSARGWTQWSDATGQFFDDDTSRQAESSSSAASSSSSSSSLPIGATPNARIIAASREAYLLHYKKSPSKGNGT